MEVVEPDRKPPTRDAGRTAAYLIGAIWAAFGYYALSAWMYRSVARGNVLTATIWTLVTITVVVVADQIVGTVLTNLYLKWQALGQHHKLAGAVGWYLDDASVKTALYVFYIFILVATALFAADPTVHILPFWNHADPQSYYGYLQANRYGVLVLVATDKLTESIRKDISKSPVRRR